MEKLWFSSTTIFLGFHNLLSKNLVIGVLKGVHTLLNGVLKERHSFFNAGVGAGVPLKFLAMSGSGSATQKTRLKTLQSKLPDNTVYSIRLKILENPKKPK